MKFIPFDISDKDHVQFMYDVRTAPQVAKNLFGTPPANLEQHIAWLEKQKNIRQIFIITIDVEDNVFIGYCQIYNIKNESVEVGWAFHPDYHGLGYGEEAVVMLIKECEKNYGQRDIELYVKNDNIPAMILYIKADFMPLSIKDDIVYMKKKYNK